MKSQKIFNPNDYDSYMTIEELVSKFNYLSNMNFQEFSLNEELTKINYEIVSSDYVDKAYKNIDEYFHLEVDEIV